MRPSFYDGYQTYVCDGNTYQNMMMQKHEAMWKKIIQPLAPEGTYRVGLGRGIDGDGKMAYVPKKMVKINE